MKMRSEDTARLTPQKTVQNVSQEEELRTLLVSAMAPFAGRYSVKPIRNPQIPQ